MKRNKIFSTILLHSLLIINVVGFFVLVWAHKNYSSISLNEIVFLFNMPLKGTPESKIQSLIQEALIPSIITLIIILCIKYIPLTKKRFSLNIDYGNKSIKWNLFPFDTYSRGQMLINVLVLSLLLISTETYLNISGYVIGQVTKSEFIENNYVSPSSVSITFPENKKNLITIYVESAETTLQDVGNGGMFEENYMPEMTQLAKDNISFSNSELLEGAAVPPGSTWTIAGLVTSSTGVPLKLFTMDGWKENEMDKYSSFLPGAISIGDILAENGYKNYFMAGSDFSFGGRTDFFTQHGNYEIFDYYSAIDENKIPSDYYVWWGFEDQKLYEYAKEKLLKLASSSEPFNFSMLTVDTHQEDGYRCDLCENEYEENYANVWRCASKQLNNFIEWIKLQDFYDDTVIVILGDHCSMDSDFFGENTAWKYTGTIKRKVYNAYINSEVEPVNEKNRLFTTLDVLPTTLASLGVEIEGDQLGLGVNLFSSKQTLSEEYGYEVLFDELNKKSTFYDEQLLYPKDETNQ